MKFKVMRRNARVMKRNAKLEAIQSNQSNTKQFRKRLGTLEI
jgi:hypothetical protein